MRLPQIVSASSLALLLAFSQDANAFSGTTETTKYCVDEDCKTQLRNLVQLARNGSGRAAAIVAMAYASGDGFEKNLDKAEHYIILGARFRDPVAAYLMADWLRNGFVLDQDIAKADEMLDLSIKYGYAPAMYDKALKILKSGDSDKTDQAVALLESAAEQSNMRAMFLLARMKETGTGAAKDVEGAVDLFQRLARARHPEAMEYLKDLAERSANAKQDSAILANLELDKNMEVIEVRGEAFEVTLVLDGLVDTLVSSGKYDQNSIGSRIRGISCNESIKCGSTKPSDDPAASTIWELITGRKLVAYF